MFSLAAASVLGGFFRAFDVWAAGDARRPFLPRFCCRLAGCAIASRLVASAPGAGPGPFRGWRGPTPGLAGAGGRAAPAGAPTAWWCWSRRLPPGCPPGPRLGAAGGRRQRRFSAGAGAPPPTDLSGAARALAGGRPAGVRATLVRRHLVGSQRGLAGRRLRRLVEVWPLSERVAAAGRRNRLRQGAFRAPGAHPRPARRQTRADRARLRHPAERAGRQRVLRPRARLFHQRPQRPRRRLRPGRPRHPFPRRGGRAAAPAPGRAAAGARRKGQYKKIGSNSWQKTRFRLVSATHRPLAARRSSAASCGPTSSIGLATFTCRLPPLRGRREDIPLLVAPFPGRTAALRGRSRAASTPTSGLAGRPRLPGQRARAAPAGAAPQVPPHRPRSAHPGRPAAGRTAARLAWPAGAGGAAGGAWEDHLGRRGGGRSRRRLRSACAS